jgi:hypothetical protein
LLPFDEMRVNECSEVTYTVSLGVCMIYYIVFILQVHVILLVYRSTVLGVGSLRMMMGMMMTALLRVYAWVWFESRLRIRGTVN